MKTSIENRRKLKSSSLRENCHSEVTKSLAYKEADRNVKKSARSDRRQYMNEKVRQTEEAASRGDSQTVCCLTKKIVCKSSIQGCPVKDENRRLLTDAEEQK